MNKIFNLTSNFKALDENDDGSVNIKGYASTIDQDRAGDIIESNAWAKGGIGNYENNPIILFNHDYHNPIGKATELEVNDNGLQIKGKISKSAGKIRDLVKEGVLGAFSVGFRVKDADYLEETDGYRIKDAELFEISVVSVPANQAATFSVAKSFDSDTEYQEWKEQFVKSNAGQSDMDSPEEAVDKTVIKETEMSETKENFDLEGFAKEVAKKTATEIAMAQAEKQAKAEADAEVAKAEAEAEEAALQEKKAEVESIVKAGTEGAERLVSDLEDRVAKDYSNIETVVEELKAELAEKSEEIVNIRESKRVFSQRGNKDWKEAFSQDIDDAYMLGKATGKGYETKFATEVLEKVNAHSGVAVSSADFEQEVSTNVERDIQNELILAPLFREIPMNAATMIMPVLPDAGYAEFTSNQAATGSSPHGNLAERGDTYGSPFGGIDLTERSLSTKKLISTSYLGNETEEDAIMPILPLIRESMIRSHARSIEAGLLVGNLADGPFGTGGACFNGIVTLASGDSDKTQSSTAFASESLTAANLLAARKNMGKYGVNASDVVYIVNQQEWYNLMDDAEFQDVNLVGSELASKVKGSVGMVYGSPVIMCDEFATPAVSKFYAVAVNPKMFAMGRLRGVTIESDYEVVNQRRVLVASQRIGFIDIIDNVTSKWALQYKAS
jgi:HK97 family phage prohead protease